MFIVCQTGHLSPITSLTQHNKTISQHYNGPILQTWNLSPEEMKSPVQGDTVSAFEISESTTGQSNQMWTHSGHWLACLSDVPPTVHPHSEGRMSPNVLPTHDCHLFREEDLGMKFNKQWVWGDLRAHPQQAEKTLLLLLPLPVSFFSQLPLTTFQCLFGLSRLWKISRSEI